jgi:hypothetical protein
VGHHPLTVAAIIVAATGEHMMAKKRRERGLATIYGVKTARGEKMLKGQWRLISPHTLEFPATLIETVNIGKTRIAIFSVPKRVGRRRAAN